MSRVLTYKDLDRPTNITVQSNNKDLGFLTFAKYGSASRIKSVGLLPTISLSTGQVASTM